MKLITSGMLNDCGSSLMRAATRCSPIAQYYSGSSCSLKLDSVKIHEGTKLCTEIAKANLPNTNPASTPAAAMIHSLIRIVYVNLERAF